MVTPEADEVSDEDFSVMNPWSPATGPPRSAEQRGRSRRDERSRSPEQTPPHSSSQDVDEDSATVDPQNRVSDRSRSPQEREGSRRQDPQQQKGKTTVAEKEPSDPPKAKKHKSVDSDKDDEEPRNEPGSSSNSQLVPVLPFNSGDEDSKYSDQYSAQSRDSERTLFHPDLYVLTNDEHWTITPWDTQICSSSWIILFFQWVKTEINKTYATWSLCRVYNNHCTSMERPTTSTTWKLKFQSELMVKLKICWNDVRLPAEGQQEQEPKWDLAHEKKHQPKKYEDTANNLLKQNIWSTNPGLTTRFFDLIDMRKVTPEKLCDGTMGAHHQDGQAKQLPQSEGQMGIKRFQDKQKEYLQTDSPASTRPGFGMSCQMAASKGWNLFHIDFKTVFLQGQSYDVNRDVVCQPPPEACHPPYIAARLKKPAYGISEASRRWWNILDKALCSYCMVPTRADRCCQVLYSVQSRERTLNQRNYTHWKDTSNISNKPHVRTEVDAASEKMLDPIAGSPATAKSVAGIINLFVDDLFGTSGTEMEQRVLARLRKEFQVGSEDWSDVTFTGQRIRWIKVSQSGRCIVG